MRALSIATLLALSTGCFPMLVTAMQPPSEYDVVLDKDYFGSPIPLKLEPVIEIDEFTVIGDPAVDVLFVVDSSCSMEDKQTPLADNFPLLMAMLETSGWDWRVGVVSMDTDRPSESGSLHQIGGDLWLDTLSLDPITSFSDAALMGTSGWGMESGLDATYLSYEDRGINGDAKNCYVDEDGYIIDCFIRDYAAFHVVAISDENDQSRIDYETGIYDYSTMASTLKFTNWMESLKGHSDMTSFSIVGWGNTSRYRKVADDTGGFKEAIYASDWTSVMQEMGETFTTSHSVYHLTYLPVVDSITVEIRGENGIDSAMFLPGNCVQCFGYDRVKNAVSISGYEPLENDRIIITYENLSYGDN